MTPFERWQADQRRAEARAASARIAGRWDSAMARMQAVNGDAANGGDVAPTPSPAVARRWAAAMRRAGIPQGYTIRDTPRERARP